MRTIRFIISAAALLLSAFSISAQDYQPKEAWPYIYREFQTGTLTLLSGAVSDSEFNIPIPSTKLHHIKDGTIMELEIDTIKDVVIKGERYINAQGKLMKVLASSDKGYVLSLVAPDEEAMNKVNIGYGISSSTASAMNVTTLLEGSASDLVNLKYDTLMERRDAGKVLPVKSSIYLMVGITVVEATKYEVTQGCGVDKKVLNNFFKTSKTKWKDAQSLLNLVNFIAENK